MYGFQWSRKRRLSVDILCLHSGEMIGNIRHGVDIRMYDLFMGRND